MRIFTRFGVMLASIMAVFCLTAVPASAQGIDFDFYVGPSSRSAPVGSCQWMQRQFINNSRSAVRTIVMPQVAARGADDGSWQGGQLDIGLPTTVRPSGATLWMTRVGRYSVNANARVTGRDENIRQRLVYIQVAMVAYGPGIERSGSVCYLDFVGTQRRGASLYDWDFYDPYHRQGYW